jgi:hypothetical protein
MGAKPQQRETTSLINCFWRLIVFRVGGRKEFCGGQLYYSKEPLWAMGNRDDTEEDMVNLILWQGKVVSSKMFSE